MRCTKKQCRQVKKTLNKLTIEELEQQLDCCFLCCNLEKLCNVRSETERSVRFKYVKEYLRINSSCCKKEVKK